MVSNGAKINLEEAAARELARLFLRPDNHAASEGFEGPGSVPTFWFRILSALASLGLLEGITDTVLALMCLVAKHASNTKNNRWAVLVIFSCSFGYGLGKLQRAMSLLWL